MQYKQPLLAIRSYKLHVYFIFFVITKNVIYYYFIFFPFLQVLFPAVRLAVYPILKQYIRLTIYYLGEDGPTHSALCRSVVPLQMF
jgi:transketolase